VTITCAGGCEGVFAESAPNFLSASIEIVVMAVVIVIVGRIGVKHGDAILVGFRIPIDTATSALDHVRGSFLLLAVGLLGSEFHLSEIRGSRAPEGVKFEFKTAVNHVGFSFTVPAQQARELAVRIDEHLDNTTPVNGDTDGSSRRGEQP